MVGKVAYIPSVSQLLPLFWYIVLAVCVQSTSAYVRRAPRNGGGSKSPHMWVIPTVCVILAVLIMIICDRYHRRLRRRTMANVLEEIRVGARYNPFKMSRVEAAYPISEEEEMQIYNRNRKWFKEAQTQGVNLWYDETFGGDSVCEVKIMKPLRTFMTIYCHALPTDPTCTGCTVQLAKREEWYRCRYCTDVNLCAECFEKGFCEPSSSHSTGHEMSLLKFNTRCNSCDAFLPDSRMDCSNCPDVHYCLGCYKSGSHQENHGDHIINKITSLSYMMLQSSFPQEPGDNNDTNRDLNSAPLQGAIAPPVYSVTVTSQDGNMTATTDNTTAVHPSDPPPSYQECIFNPST